MPIEFAPLLAQAVEYEPGKVQGGSLLMAIFFPIFLGVAILGFGASKEKDGGKKWVKYISLPILAMMANYGYKYYAYANDRVAQQLNLVGGNSKTIYNAAFLVPLILLIFGVGFCIYWDKFRRPDETY